MRLSSSIARRALLSVAAATSPLLPRLPAAASVNPVRDGMAAFSAGNVERSIALFDEAIAVKPASQPYLWQRGLSLYCTRHTVFEPNIDQLSLTAVVDLSPVVPNGRCRQV